VQYHRSFLKPTFLLVPRGELRRSCNVTRIMHSLEIYFKEALRIHVPFKEMEHQRLLSASTRSCGVNFILYLVVLYHTNRGVGCKILVRGRPPRVSHPLLVSLGC
jgi:hypothetical protein